MKGFPAPEPSTMSIPSAARDAESKLISEVVPSEKTLACSLSGDMQGFFVIKGVNMASYDDFAKLDIRVGRIVEVMDFPEARKPAYKLKIDFGAEIGIKASSAQLVKHYKKEELLGKLVLGVVNFPKRQVGPFMSEVLTLGVPDSEAACILITPDKNEAVVGGKLY
jgi:tRNA-binding protein